jgi:hypothetical protein
LSKIVENSEKTKMTTTNMGICFGVSLISSNSGNNNQLNSVSTAQISSLSSSSGVNQQEAATMMPTKMIDMATATNVFDFLLTNHNELLPGDINFLGSGTNTLNTRQPPSFYQSSSKLPSLQGGENLNNNNNNNNSNNTTNTNTTTTNNTVKQIIANHTFSGNSNNNSSISERENLSNRYSVMVNDSPTTSVTNASLNDSQSNHNHHQQHPNTSFHKYSNNVGASNMNSPSNSSILATQHVNRHIKNNSIGYLDVGENGGGGSPISNNSNNQNNINKVFPPIATQTNASSTVSLEYESF